MSAVQPRKTQQQWQFDVEIEGFEPSLFVAASEVVGHVVDGRVAWLPATLRRLLPSEETRSPVLDWYDSRAPRLVKLKRFNREGNLLSTTILYGATVTGFSLFPHSDGRVSDTATEEFTVTFTRASTHAAGLEPT